MSGVIRANTVTEAVVRVAGEVGTDITVSHAGTAECEAGLRAGQVLIYVRSGQLAGRVARIWAAARPLCAGLPYLAGTSRLHLPARVGLVGVIVHLGGMPACTADLVAPRPGQAVPAYVRLQVGPITWQVCDQAAWHSLGRAWTKLSDQLTQTQA